jgi:head-tail adaptor
MQVNPGVFNKKIDIIEFLITKDPDGFDIITENLILTCWAQVSNTSGTEIIRSNSDFSSVKTRFFLRTPRVNLDKDFKIKFKNNIYEIIYINNYNFYGIYTEITGNLVAK